MQKFGLKGKKNTFYIQRNWWSVFKKYMENVYFHSILKFALIFFNMHSSKTEKVRLSL